MTANGKSSAPSLPVLGPDELPRAKYEIREEGAGRPIVWLTLALVLGNAFLLLKEMLYGTKSQPPIPPKPSIMPFELAPDPPVPRARPDAPLTPSNDEPVDDDQESRSTNGVQFEQISPRPPAPHTGSSGIPAQGDALFPLRHGAPVARTGGAFNDNTPPDVLSSRIGSDGARGPSGGSPSGSGSPGSGGTGSGSGGQGGGAGGSSDGNGGSQPPPNRVNRPPSIAQSVSLPDIYISQSVLISASMLLAGASDADGDLLRITNIRASAGTIEKVAGETWKYTAAPEELGEVTFTYEVSDSQLSVAQTARLRVVELPGASIVGTEAAETLLGTPGRDTIEARGGDDTVLGRESNDAIDGGAGDDTIYAGAGRDVVHGGAGNDIIFGGDGHDTLFGGDGNDSIFGGDGNDVVFGENGDDIVDPGTGADVVSLGEGSDTLLLAGDSDVDVYDGGAGIDVVDYAPLTPGRAVVVDLAAETAMEVASEVSQGAPNPPTDILVGFENVVGSPGADVITGDSNDNVLRGGAGDDVVAGGEGNDVFVATEGDGNDRYAGGAGDDTLDMSAALLPLRIDLSAGFITASDGQVDEVAGIESVIGGNGDDIIVASTDRNDLTGGPGHDAFVFRSTHAAGNGLGTRDRILDYSVGDRVDLDGVLDELAASDAAQVPSDDQIRKFVLMQEGEAFSRPGQIRIAYEELGDRSVAVLQGNVDHDPDVDFEIEIHGLQTHAFQW